MPITDVANLSVCDSLYLIVRSSVTLSQARTYLRNNNVPEKYIDILTGIARQCDKVTYTFGTLRRCLYGGTEHYALEIDRRFLPRIGQALVQLVNGTSLAMLLTKSEMGQLA